MKARPTIYNGVQMRSRLEARVAAWLDSIGVRWAYEPVAFASPKGQYLPDFGIDLFDWRKTYLEVKPSIDQETSDDTFARMEIIWESDGTAMLVVLYADAAEGGMLIAATPSIDGWKGMYLVRCPCQALCIGSLRLIDVKDNRGEPWIVSTCGSCGDEAMRRTDAALRLPRWDAQA